MMTQNWFPVTWQWITVCYNWRQLWYSRKCVTELSVHTNHLTRVPTVKLFTCVTKLISLFDCISSARFLVNYFRLTAATITSLTRSRGPSNGVAWKPTISNTTFRALREGLATRIESAMVKIKLQATPWKPDSSIANILWLSVPRACASLAEHNEMPQNQQSNRHINIVYFQLLSAQRLFQLHCSAWCRCNARTREEKFREFEGKFHMKLRFE